MPTENKTQTPRIYVACLAAYNSGKLHGSWINCDQDAESIWAEINAMLAKSPEPDAEEHAVHDFEGFGSLNLGEWPDIEQVAELAALMQEHGEIFSELVSHFGGLENLDEAKTAMEESYQGSHDSLEDFAYELLEDTGALKDLPDNLRCYFDYKAYGRDLELGGDVFTVEVSHQIHIFWNR